MGQQIFPADREICFSQLPKTKFPSAIDQAKLVFICSNSATLIVE